jgi:hypothetical protein
MTALRVPAILAAGLLLPALAPAAALARDVLPPPPDASGTAACNERLGRSFPDTMLNEEDTARRDR